MAPHPTPATYSAPIEPGPDEVLHRFARHTLPHEAWTHEAHLIVCWYAVTLLGADGALDHLRQAIRAFNDTIGIANTDHSGYHETLTRYYVGAVAHADADRPTFLASHPWCTRRTPLGCWSREVLFTPAARARWLAPDLAPCPWERAAI